ncbi:MAG: hypothetical protein IH606_08175 [Burkholderiales bacterium]|nr:hypothetical protein [Burkholderiales bacterium]
MAIVATSGRVYQAPGTVEERDRILDEVAYTCGPQLVYDLAVQPFAAGGFEGVVYLHSDKSKMAVLPWDLPEIEQDRYPRQRSEPAERDENSIEVSRRRTKRMIRWHCKNIGVDHLLTFTTRELSNTPGDLWVKWQRFIKAYRKATGEELPCVTLPEPHPTNPDHWHLHVATRGYFNLEVARPIWWKVCGGRGEGNVQVEYLKVREGGWKAHKIACYISKYVTKALITSDRFNKKRYSVSKSVLVKRGRTRLNAENIAEALKEVAERFGINLLGLRTLNGCLFEFPDGTGFWFQIPPSETHPHQIWNDPPF